MSALVAPALVAAALLVLAGAQKVLDPTMATGAMRSLRLPATDLLVRVGSAAEMVIGTLAIVVGGALWWGLVALSYAAFVVFVLAAMRSGTMIASCGCFGREETPPHPVHVALDALLAGVAIAMMPGNDAPVLDQLADEPGRGVVVAALAALATYLVFAAFVHLPRALRTSRRRPATR